MIVLVVYSDEKPDHPLLEQACDGMWYLMQDRKSIEIEGAEEMDLKSFLISICTKSNIQYSKLIRNISMNL